MAFYLVNLDSTELLPSFDGGVNIVDMIISLRILYLSSPIYPALRFLF